MNYIRIYNMDLVNGKGVRVVMFVAGCNHKCDGCYNRSSWNPRNGTPYTEETENELIKLLSNPHVDGLTLTGGDPFYRTNHPTLLKLLQRVRATFPDKDVWVWTGYTLEALQGDTERSKLLPFIDVLIDGRYEKDLPTKKPFRGSDNQRMIEFKKNSIEIKNIA